MKQKLTSILLLMSMMAFGQSAEKENLAKFFIAGDYQSVIEKAMPLLEKDPSNIELNLLIGQSYAKQADYKSAMPFLNATLTNDQNNSWQRAWALSYLGTCHFMMQTYDASKKCIQECIQLKATKNVTSRAYEQWALFGFDKIYDNWKTIDTEHFRFYFQSMSENEIETYISKKEAAYQEINEFFNSQLPKKIDYFVWHSRTDAKKVLRANLGFARPVNCVVHSFYQQTIGHEMTHVISAYTSDISATTWFINEGTAVCFDQSKQNRTKQVKDWISDNDKKIVIKDYWANGREYPEEILYPLAGLFVQALIDHFGKESFLEFFKNQTYDNAKLVYGNELDVLIKEFENTINRP